MKKLPKHTPGPWYIRGVDAAHAQVAGNRGETIAKVWLHDDGGPMFSTANAHLIAAAPELLVWVKRLYFVIPHEERRKISIELGRVIAKAEGIANE